MSPSTAAANALSSAPARATAMPDALSVVSVHARDLRRLAGGAIAPASHAGAVERPTTLRQRTFDSPPWATSEASSALRPPRIACARLLPSSWRLTVLAKTSAFAAPISLPTPI